jgi:spermidine/putrescine transport system ATP-binding protein
VTVAVRPEKVAFATDVPDSAQGWNALDGLIAEVIYLGTHTHYVVHLPSGAAVVVHRQNQALGGPLPQPGDRARIVFDPAATTVLVE